MFNKLLAVLFFILFLVGCTSNTVASNSKESNLKFFVASADMSDLVISTKKADPTNLAAIVEETIKLNATCISPNTKVLGIKVDNNTAYVNLSREFDDPNTNSSAAAIIKINSIVNVLCLNEVLNIKSVVFLIEDKQLESVGPILTNNPISPKKY